MAVLLLLGFLVPMATLSVVSLNAVRQQGEKERAQILQQTLEHVRNTLDSELTQALTLSLAYTTDVELNRLLDASYPTAYDYLLAYQADIRAAIALSPAFDIVDRLRIYTDNPTIVSGEGVAVVTDLEADLGVELQRLAAWDVAGQEAQLWLSTQQSLTRSELDVSLVRRMDALPQLRQYGRVLRVSLSLSKLESCVQGLGFFREMLLVDGEGRVIVSSGATHSVGAPLRVLDRSALAGDEALLELPLTVAPALRLVGIYPRDTLLDSYSHFLGRYSAYAAVILLGWLGLSALLARTHAARLRRIGDCAADIAQGRFTQMDEAAMGSDEVGRLAALINRMSAQLQAHIEQEYGARVRQAQLEREKALAELNALQSQVDPHFLFNAMEAVRLKARSRGETETARMITYMARMFRRLLDWREDLIPLEDELAFIQEFLTIQRYRYDDDFTFPVTVEAGLGQVRIPKMLLQPLVENACVHGLRADDARREGALVIRREGDHLLALVEDHGEGMTPQRLAQVRRLLREGDNAMGSVGLRNVQRRCRLYYGAAADLDAAPRPGGGTIFTLRIPLCVQKEAFDVPGTDRG